MEPESQELDAALQAELVRRVLALEGREDTLRLTNLQLESTVESLSECTRVSPQEIREIAKELSRAATIDARAAPLERAPASLSTSRSKWGVALLMIGFSLFPMFKWLAPTPAITPASMGALVGDGAGSSAAGATDSFLTSAAGVGGTFHKKALLGGAMADISAVKMMVLEHYFMEGSYPASLEVMGLQSEQMVSSHISGVEIENNGAILARLDESIGEDMQLKLVPREVMGGHSIEWGCFSNLPPFVLSGTPCKQL